MIWAEPAVTRMVSVPAPPTTYVLLLLKLIVPAVTGMSVKTVCPDVVLPKKSASAPAASGTNPVLQLLSVFQSPELFCDQAGAAVATVFMISYMPDESDARLWLNVPVRWPKSVLVERFST